MNLIFLILQFILLIIQILFYYKTSKKIKETENTIIFKLQEGSTTKKLTKNTKTKKEGK